MAGLIPYEGRYKGRVIDAALEESKNSTSVCLAINVRLDSFWYPKDNENEAGFYCPPEFRPVETVARVYIIKANGDTNESGCEQLKDAFGWNGDWSWFDATGGIDWSSFEIQVSVKEEEYKGKKRMKCGWVYNADAVPGFSVGNIEPSKIKTLAARYASNTRALCGGGTKPAPAGKPVTPTRQTRPPAKADAPVADDGGEMGAPASGWLKRPADLPADDSDIPY